MSSEPTSSSTVHKQLAPFRQLEVFHRRLKRWRIRPAAASIHAQATRASLRALLHLGDAVYASNGEAKRKLRAVRRWLCRLSILIEDMADEKQLPVHELNAAMHTLHVLSRAIDELDCRPVSQWTEAGDRLSDSPTFFSFDPGSEALAGPVEYPVQGSADPPLTDLADLRAGSYDSPPG